MIPEDCGIIRYDDLIGVLVKRRHDLGLSQGDVDYISGLQEGYTGKIESWRHPKSGRTIGRISMPLLLEALGVALVVVTKTGEVLSRVHGRKPGAIDHQPAWPNPEIVFKRDRSNKAKATTFS